MSAYFTYQIEWHEDAQRDMFYILEYLKDVNPRVAQRYAIQFKEATTLMAVMPEIAQQWAVNPSYRCWVVAPYKIFYRINEEEKKIVIAGILHGKQKNPEW